MEPRILWAVIALNACSAIFSLLRIRRADAHAWEAAKAVILRDRILEDVWQVVYKFDAEAKQDPDAALRYELAAQRVRGALIHPRGIA